MQRQVMQEVSSAHDPSQADSDTFYGTKAPGNRIKDTFDEDGVVQPFQVYVLEV